MQFTRDKPESHLNVLLHLHRFKSCEEHHWCQLRGEFFSRWWQVFNPTKYRKYSRMWCSGPRLYNFEIRHAQFCRFYQQNELRWMSIRQDFSWRKITMLRTRHILFFQHSPNSLTTSLLQLLFYSCQLCNWQHPKPIDSYFSEQGTGWCRLTGSWHFWGTVS